MSMLVAQELWFNVAASNDFNMLNEFNVGSLGWYGLVRFRTISVPTFHCVCLVEWEGGNYFSDTWTMPIITNLSSTIPQFPETRPLQRIVSLSNQDQPLHLNLSSKTSPEPRQGKRSKGRAGEFPAKKHQHFPLSANLKYTIINLSWLLDLLIFEHVAIYFLYFPDASRRIIFATFVRCRKTYIRLRV